MKTKAVSVFCTFGYLGVNPETRMRIVLTPCFLVLSLIGYCQIQEAPPRDDGEGPWPLLIVRGATLINSTGAPPIGPVSYPPRDPVAGAAKRPKSSMSPFP